MSQGSSDLHQTPLPKPDDQVAHVQDEVMAEISDDGRPPPAELRRREWGWFTAIAFVAVIGFAVIVLASGMEFATLWAALSLGLGFLVLASPVIIVGQMRAREQHAAHEAAAAPEKSRP